MIFTNQLHIVWADFTFALERTNIKRYIEQAMKRFGYKSVMFSKIWMSKEKCITKEKFDMEYEITNDEEKNKRERDDYSVGEDLDTLLRKIKNGEVTKETIPEDGEVKWSHLLCLLDKEERRSLDSKDKNFLETFLHGNYADVPDVEWKQTEFKHLKFSRSLAGRQTHFIDTKVESEIE